jgi:hypothetical protein
LRQRTASKATSWPSGDLGGVADPRRVGKLSAPGAVRVHAEDLEGVAAVVGFPGVH